MTHYKIGTMQAKINRSKKMIWGTFLTSNSDKWVIWQTLLMQHLSIKTKLYVLSLVWDMKMYIYKTIFVNPFMRCCSVATIYTPLNEFCNVRNTRFLNSSLNWMIFLVHNWINLNNIKLALRNWIVVFVMNRFGIWYLLCNVIVNNLILLQKIKIFDLICTKSIRRRFCDLWPLFGHCIK